METTTYYPLFHPPLNLALWLTRFFSTFTAIVYFILQADEMLKMTSCWKQPIPRILLFGISFCVRFRLSIFRSIFICVEIDASVFLAVWAAAVAIDSFAAAWAGVGFNAIIWKAFYFFFFSHNSPAYRLFFPNSSQSFHERIKLFLIKFLSPSTVKWSEDIFAHCEDSVLAVAEASKSHLISVKIVSHPNFDLPNYFWLKQFSLAIIAYGIN